MKAAPNSPNAPAMTSTVPPIARAPGPGLSPAHGPGCRRTLASRRGNNQGAAILTPAAARRDP